MLFSTGGSEITNFEKVKTQTTKSGFDGLGLL